jgi:hypothetical protein
MKPEERDAVVIEQCAMVCERLAREWVRADAGTSAYAAQDCADAIRALTAQSPAGVPPEPESGGLLDVTREFRAMQAADCDGWAHEDGWTLMATVDAEALKRDALAYRAGVPTTEPVAPIARDAVRLRWLHSQASCTPDAEGYQWGVYRVRWEDGRPASVLATLSDSSDLDAVIADRAFALCTCDTKTPELSCHTVDCAFRVWALAAPQAPVEPVAQEPVAVLPCPGCGKSPDVSDNDHFLLTDGVKWGALACCWTGPEVRTGYAPIPAWKEAAIAAWNQRAPPISLPVEVPREPTDAMVMAGHRVGMKGRESFNYIRAVWKDMYDAAQKVTRG